METLHNLEQQAEKVWEAVTQPLSNVAAEVEKAAEHVVPLVEKESEMVHSGQAASVLENFMNMVETEALNAVLPVFVKALSDVEQQLQSGNHLNLSQMGAKFVEDMATAVPVLELDAIKAASALWQKLVVVVNTKLATASPVKQQDPTA